MSKSPKLYVAVLALTIAALLLGAAGTATAGALTKSTVRKIAAKVVKKQAKSLSVAHAATSDFATAAADAGSLGGKAPAAYSDDTLRYSLVSTTLSTTKSFVLAGLTPGATYYVHYHLLMGNSPGTPSGNCAILVPASANQFGWSYGTVFANAVSFDGGAIVTVPSAGNISVSCSLASTASMFANQPSFAEATPLDTVTSRAATATPARPEDGLAGTGGAPRP